GSRRQLVYPHSGCALRATPSPGKPLGSSKGGSRRPKGAPASRSGSPAGGRSADGADGLGSPAGGRSAHGADGFGSPAGGRSASVADARTLSAGVGATALETPFRAPKPALVRPPGPSA